MDVGGGRFLGLPAETPVARLIAETYPTMSRAQRLFADLVRAEPLKVARLSIHDAVAGAGISVATANRFATALGFAGYPEFRAELIRGFEDFFVPVERLKRKRAENATPLEVARASLGEDMDNLTRSAAELTDAAIDGAVARIVGARRIFVAGFDLAAHLAGILAIGLSMAGCDARAAPAGGGTVGSIRTLATFGPEDLVISIAFPHYFRETLQLTDFARRAGVPVIAITDGLASPLVGMARVSLFATAHHDYNPPSSTAIMAVLEALIAAVASVKPEATEAGERFASAAYPMMTTGDDWD